MLRPPKEGRCAPVMRIKYADEHNEDKKETKRWKLIDSESSQDDVNLLSRGKTFMPPEFVDA